MSGAEGRRARRRFQIPVEDLVDEAAELTRDAPGELDGPSDAAAPTWSMVPGVQEIIEPEVVPPPSIAPPPTLDPDAAPPVPAETFPAASAGPGATRTWQAPGARSRVPPPPSSRGPEYTVPPPVPIHPAATPAAANGDLVEAVPRHAAEEPRLLLPHARRQRRSRQSEMPPRPAERYDVPDDSAGRVQYVEQPVVIEHPRAAPHRAAAPSTAAAPIPRADQVAGWIAVGALAVVLLIVFILGMKLTS